MPPEIRGLSFAKALCPELLSGVIFDVYDQHTQIITELDVKLNKWHITLLYRKPTETEQILKIWPVESNREPKLQQAKAIALRQQATRLQSTSNLSTPKGWKAELA